MRDGGGDARAVEGSEERGGALALWAGFVNEVALRLGGGGV